MDSLEVHSSLIKLVDRLFDRKAGVNSLNQELAELFFPERAAFTGIASINADLASDLYDSHTVRVRRDLGNAFGAMLRPRGQEWFFINAPSVKNLTTYGRAYLQGCEETMRGLFYDRRSGFVRTMKETDHAYATFGNGVITIEPSYKYMRVQYKSWPLETVAWGEDECGEPSPIVRKDCMSARQIAANKKNKLPKEISEKADDPAKEDDTFDISHIVMPADQWGDYSGEKARTPWVSIYLCREPKVILRVEQIRSKRYVIPRWQTIEGSAYALSPSATTALADARMIQKLAFLTMEGVEKRVDPPTIARADAVLSGINLMSGATTWVNKAWDEAKGPAVKAFDFGNDVSVGEEMIKGLHEALSDGFFLNKLNLPQGSGKTDYETQMLVQEYIRNAIPLFEPLETEYTQPVLDVSFNEMMALGLFGPKQHIPDELTGTDVEFVFSNILQEAIHRQKARKMGSLAGLLQIAVQMEQVAQSQAGRRLKLIDMFREAGMADTPATWWLDEKDVPEIDTSGQDAMQGLGQIAGAAKGVKTIADATNSTVTAMSNVGQLASSGAAQ